MARPRADGRPAAPQGHLEGMLDFFDGQSAYYPCFDAALRSMVNDRFAEEQSAQTSATDVGSDEP